MPDSNDMTVKPTHTKLMPPKTRKVLERGITSPEDVQELIFATVDDVINERISDVRGQVVSGLIGKSIAQQQVQLGLSRGNGTPKSPFKLTSKK